MQDPADICDQKQDAYATMSEGPEDMLLNAREALSLGELNELKPAILKETGELVMVIYVDRHPAEGARYEILERRALPGEGQLVYEYELTFDPFTIASFPDACVKGAMP